ncbi:MAG: hypothetical protein H7A55_18045 [Verrucomicrobiaceae bacterium]|nr:hypothetical protein [Verrucomicrobiaceae bacterium]
MVYIFEGLIVSILAADASGIQGSWDRQLGLPFGRIAEEIWIAVPILFLVLAIPSIRNQLGRWQHAPHAVAIGCVFFPVLTLFTQTRQIPLNHFPTTDASRALREQFHGQVLIVGEGSRTVAYVSNALDHDKVAEAIFALDPTVKPSNPNTATEQQ